MYFKNIDGDFKFYVHIFKKMGEISQNFFFSSWVFFFFVYSYIQIIGKKDIF